MIDAPRQTVPGSIGVFGGTFDPIHVAHLALAEEAAETLGLERVLFVPAGRPPHKPDVVVTPSAHRLAMVQLAAAGNPRFAVEMMELERHGPSFTVDTLEAIRARVGATADLWLLLSAEAFAEFGTWREPARILGLARIAVAPRDGYPDAGIEAVNALGVADAADRVTFLERPRLRLSATEIRARAAAGRSVRYLVPDAVAAYIGDHALYLDPRRTT